MILHERAVSLAEMDIKKDSSTSRMSMINVALNIVGLLSGSGSDLKHDRKVQKEDC
jgi:hypothetical protein